jgi:NTP pyrophosphatase (non-canonical NTP hydrolase)
MCLPTSEESTAQDSIIVPLLGLAGEAGELLSEYKKQLRDGASHTLHSERVREELGDMLWYLANLASKYDISLESIAQANLRKTRNRWIAGVQFPLSGDVLPDESFPPAFEAQLIEDKDDRGVTSRLLLEGKQIGATLTDNSYDPDGYRFHDVFHLTFAAMLGWSPVIRSLLKRKRRSNPKLDEVEDGGRAVVIEEGIAVLVFAYARNHAWLRGVTELDYDLLRTINNMTAHLEVKNRSTAEWEAAILKAYELWRSIVRDGGGKLHIDTLGRTISLLQ